MRRIATAGFIGTAIEFYDYYIYGTVAALVLNEAFFPELSESAGTLATLSTFAVGFAARPPARPLGAAVFGHFGDLVGRKAVLVVSLLMTGLSTGLIVLLPGYDTLGVAAPILWCCYSPPPSPSSSCRRRWTTKPSPSSWSP